MANRSHIRYRRNPLGLMGKPWQGRKVQDQVTAQFCYEEDLITDPWGFLVDGRNLNAIDGDPEYGEMERDR